MTKKKDQLDIVTQVFKKNANYEILLDRLKKSKKDFFFRKTNYMVSVVTDGVEYVYKPRVKANNINFATNQLWIFNAVKLDVMRYLETNPNFKLPQKLPVNVTNYDYDDSYGEVTGTDVNSAYWVIAYNLGIISERLMEKCKESKFKVVRLASLAVLGRSFTYENYKEGVKSSNLTIEAEDDRLKSIYRWIRYKCYEMMGELSMVLGKDFEAYRTDCIYYRDTMENRKKVYAYLDERGFEYKQLVFGEEETLENDTTK
jgi:hypothetical protein